ncbi:Mbov_0399 family ICE element protein [Mesomycoplasma molare]|uniref:ICEF-II n=1 Tax=Mesomycoplasma molare TaxID=171288 RepID=A0ABY5TWL8_9BACT|nr:hypothetical protein [Mesomycoplasma molare]UWD33921.1 hypothetical protein NX772_02305 [Mesomycoplasma molare]
MNFNTVTYTNINKIDSEILASSTTNHNINNHIELEDYINISKILDNSLIYKNFSSLNSTKKPFTRFYDSKFFYTKSASHYYSNKHGGHLLGYWQNYLNSGWYGANINIAKGLEGWTIDFFQLKKTEYIGSKRRKNGLDFDNGNFAKHSSNEVIDVLKNEHKRLQFYFGLEKENDNFIDTQFSLYGSYGINLSDFVFKKLNKKIDEYKLIYSKNGNKIKSFYINNLKVDFNFYIETEKRDSKEFDKLNSRVTDLKVKISFDTRINYENTNFQQVEILNNIKLVKENFNNYFIQNNKIELQTDSGYHNGLYTDKKISSYTSNIEYLERKIADFKRQIANIKYSSEFNLKYSTNFDNRKEKISFFLEYTNRITNKKELIKISNALEIKWIETEIFKSKNIKERLEIIPSKYLNWKNNDSLELVDDEKTRKENDKEISDIYGGHWYYNAPVKVNFKTTLNENEILYINGKKVDVLDQNFFFDLTLNKNENSNSVFKIELVKFDKKSVVEENKTEIFRWHTIIEIKNQNLKLKLKWFAWNPENNKEQEKLITEFLKNDKGEYLLSSDGSKIKNPKFDPLIDKETGTKKQIVWVDFSDNENNLPLGTRFMQDPVDNNNNITENYENNTGFIAEAVVVEKGINLQINDSYPIKKYKIIENNDFFRIFNSNPDSNEHNNISEIKVSENENNYFSTSGLWLFSSKTEKGLNNYKLVLIGNNVSNKKFTSIFVNKKVTNFFDSSQGKHLKKFLIDKYKLNNKEINALTYETILKYWTEYVSETLWNHAKHNENKILINPLIQEELLKKFSYQIEREKFSENVDNYNNFISEFKNKDKVNWNIELSEEDKNIIKISFFISNNFNSIDYELSQEIFYFKVSWKNNKTQEDEISNNENFFEIIPKLNKKEINDSFKKNSDFFPTNEWYDFENKEKVVVNINKNSDKLFFNFEILENFKDSFFIREENKFIEMSIQTNNNFLNENKLLFFDFKSEEIYLNNLKNKSEIEENILSFLRDNISLNYTFEKDYYIENFEEKIEEILENGTSNNKSPVLIKIINANSNENKLLKVFNFLNVSENNRKEIDLSKIKIDDLVLEDSDNQIEIAEEIKKIINKEVRKINLVFDQDLEIQFFNEKLIVLIHNKNKFIKFKILGKYSNIKNYFILNVKINSQQENKILDLSNFKIDTIRTNSDNFFELKNTIIENIRKYFAEFLLEYKKDFIIEEIDSKEKIRELVLSKGENTANFRLIAKNTKRVSGHINFYVLNYLSENSFLKSDDIFLENKNSLKQKNKHNYQWLFTPIAFSSFFIVILITKIYRKFFKYKK